MTVGQQSTAGSVDIEAVAGAAIESAPSTTPVATSALPPANTTAVQSGPEPVRHQVKRGETAYTVARLYQVSVKSLGEWNGLGSDFAIREGQYLLIPVANAAPPDQSAGNSAVTAPGTGSPTPTPPSAVTPLPENEVAAAEPVETPQTTLAPASQASNNSAAMIYPVQGRIIRGYSKGSNEGIDISAAPGTAVKAADDGTVAAITEDADQVPIIVVRHADNLLTVYANVTGIKVSKDERVRKGQDIAALRSGDAAYVHFEIRQGFDSVDPTPYLN
jgi:murein DD-endopeptidase MepM/ murein hydrolase activator NlpD